MTSAKDQEQASIDVEAARWFAHWRAAAPDGVTPDAGEARAFQAWLDADPRHREVYDLMQRTFDDVAWTVPDARGGAGPRSFAAWQIGLAIFVTIAFAAIISAVLFLGK